MLKGHSIIIIIYQHYNFIVMFCTGELKMGNVSFFFRLIIHNAG